MDAATNVDACDQPSGYVNNADDCDDTDPDTNPGAFEYCDGHDDDCDGSVDENDALDVLSWYIDSDGDGDGDSGATAVPACSQPSSSYSATNGDCDDTDTTISSLAEELCDEIDQTCDGTLGFDYIVSPNSTATTYRTIASAIAVSSSGDEICVLAGTYAEELQILGKDLVIVGEDRDTAIVDADGGDRPLYLSNLGASSEIRSLTFTGGTNHEGAGAYIDDAATTFVDVLFTGNEAYSVTSNCYGGVIYTTGRTQPTFSYIDIIENSVECPRPWGGLVYLRNSLGVTYFDHLRVIGNSVIGDGQMQPGITGYRSGAYITNGIFAGNEVIWDGTGTGQVRGGLMSAVVSGAFTLENVTIHGIEVDGSGLAALEGGVGYFEAGTSITVVNSTISEVDLIDATSSLASVFWTNGSLGTYNFSNFYDLPTPEFNSTAPSTSGGNVEVDPDFTDVSSADPTEWDLTLGTSSSLINAGDPNTVYDDADGTRNDIGAHGGPDGSW